MESEKHCKNAHLILRWKKRLKEKKNGKTLDRIRLQLHRETGLKQVPYAYA